MTQRENNVLGEIKLDINGLKDDMRKCLDFIATYTERSKHCEAEFVDLYTMAKFNRKTLLIFMGGLSVASFMLGLLVKVLK